MAAQTQTQLDFVYQHERSRGGEVWLSQPLGGGRCATSPSRKGWVRCAAWPRTSSR